MTSRPTSRLELWGGAECTVNRVGSEYVDQIELTGFDRRLDDLDRFADLGVSALRFPVLWERTAPNGLEDADWSWADERLRRLRELGIRPIVGLVHHGSGPRSTSLTDPTFPEKLAVFAHAAAERYPWIEDWTPVNEPLTTARFSCLYGHWYPHSRDDVSFARALVVQCRAVALAMRAIREVIPGARLVQTEDVGKTHSTRVLAYQAEFENERRWVALDLLTGRLAPQEPMWDWLLDAGWIRPQVLEWFRDYPCPPDVIGINHYLSSERFLDERLDRYPADSHGGNGRHEYADVLAARVRGEGADGPRTLLLEAWQRYGLPLAVTEAHNGCTREEQLRWLRQVWDDAVQARVAGADVRAVTVWSLLGAVGWDQLATRANGRYEPGAYDVRAPVPRATALAAMTRSLAGGAAYEHPVLEGRGWWRRRERLWYPPFGPVGDEESEPASGAPVVIAGKTGTLGRAFARLCELRGIRYVALSRADLDIASPVAVERLLARLRPWAVVNAAGYVRVDDAEAEPARCLRENLEGAETLAAACRHAGVRLVTFSSDLVFDGRKRTPYLESDDVGPLSTYGWSKAAAEARVLAADPDALVVRTSAFFGPWDDHNFVTLALRSLAVGAPFAVDADAVISPTYVPDLVNAALDLLIDGERGLWHLANDGATTSAELAAEAASLAGVSTTRLQLRSSGELRRAAARPRYSALGSERGLVLPPLEDALTRYVEEFAAAA